MNATEQYETWILQTVQGGWFKEMGPSMRALIGLGNFEMEQLVEVEKQLIDVAPFLAELDKRLCPANCRALRAGARGVLLGYQNATYITHVAVAGWQAFPKLAEAVQGMMNAGDLFTTALDLSVMVGDGGCKQ
jgi:hypothetical protein